jgi:T5SS/PEP-CTERM-associated repeat protein
MHRIAVCALLLSACAVSATGQVKIEPRHVPGVENPDDPGDLYLKDAFAAAVEIWTRVLDGDRTFRFTYSYDHVSDGIGAWDRIGHKEHVRIDPDVRLFYDPTPLENEEFDLRPTLVMHLDPAKVPAWLPGDVPPVLEVAYGGAAPYGSPAYKKTDLLTVVLHEIGHHLALHDPNRKYDVFPPRFGRPALRAASNGGNHFLPPQPLMFENPASGGRTLPSALDALVVATEQGMHGVVLPRKYLMRATGTVAWSDHTQWVGYEVPRGGDFASLLDGVRSRLDRFADRAHRELNDLRIAEGSRLEVELRDPQALPWTVRSTCEVEGARDGSPSELALRGSLELPQPLFEAGRLVLREETRLTLDGCRANLGELKIEGARVAGNGQLSVDALAAFGGAWVEALGGDLDFTATRVTTASGVGGRPSLYAGGGTLRLRAAPGAGSGVLWDLGLEALLVDDGRRVELPNCDVSVFDEARLLGGATLEVGGELTLGPGTAARMLVLDTASVRAANAQIRYRSHAALIGGQALLELAGPCEVDEGSLALYGARLSSSGGPGRPDTIGRQFRLASGPNDRALGSVLLHGVGTEWQAGLVHVGGRSGEGELDVLAGASCTADELILALSPPRFLGPPSALRTASVGTLRVVGTNSRVDVSRNLVVGSRGWGRVTVRGGTLSCGGGAVLGRHLTDLTQDAVADIQRLKQPPPELFSGDGSVEVEAGGAFDVAGDLVVADDGTATLNVMAGGRVECQNLLVGVGQGRGLVEVRGEFEVRGALGVGPDPFTSPAPQTWPGDVTIYTGGTLEVHGPIQLREGATLGMYQATVSAARLDSAGGVGGSGTLRSQSPSSRLVFRNTGRFGPSAAFEVDGDYVQTAAAELIVGLKPNWTVQGGVHVTGDVTLDGDVRIATGAAAPPGTRIEFLTAAGTVQASAQVVSPFGSWTIVVDPGAPTRVYLEAQP